MKITIDVNAPAIPTDRSWQFGIGADHAHQFHRTDMVEQLKFAHDELGFRQVRFHGSFNDDMWTYNTFRAFAPLPGKGGAVYERNFRQVGHVLDNVLSCGVKPFVELSFMPRELARGNKQGLKYVNNICPPRKDSEWMEYLTAFLQFLFQRYGREEVENWWFEVWNEPDLGGFFAGSQKDYFHLYEVTARTLKSVSPNLKVGGPSTSACRWIEEFLDFCRANSVPLDFVSTHHYPGDGFGNAVTVSSYGKIAKIMLDAWKKGRPLGDAMADMFFHPEAAARVPKGALCEMDDSLLAKTENLPTVISEWNSMAIYAAPIHDEKYSAAFVCKSVLDLDGRFQGYMFWNLSDIYEEQVQLNRPFSGGFGILTVDGIPKPSFWAFKLLSKLFPARLEGGFRTQMPVEYAVFRDGERVQVLLYAQSNDPTEDKHYDVELELNAQVITATAEKIDDSHCNPKALWQALGSPDDLTLIQVREVKEASRLHTEKANVQTVGGKAILHAALRTNDIHLYTFTLVQ